MRLFSFSGQSKQRFYLLLINYSPFCKYFFIKSKNRTTKTLYIHQFIMSRMKKSKRLLVKIYIFNAKQTFLEMYLVTYIYFNYNIGCKNPQKHIHNIYLVRNFGTNTEEKKTQKHSPIRGSNGGNEREFVDHVSFQM